MDVIKRDGAKEVYNSNKIYNALVSAFKSVNQFDNHTDTCIHQFIDELEKNITDGVSVESIQNNIEQWLMLNFCDVAKSFILYRERHRINREFVNNKIAFIERYKNSDNTANATIDDNSNVSNHNIAVLNSEIHKQENAEINLREWEYKLRQLYPDFNYKQLRKDANTICYLHDLNSQIGEPYCVAISMYPFLLNGIKDIGGLSAKPTNIDSFCGMFVNLVFAIAAQYKGAVATPGIFICMDYFLKKEWGDLYYTKPDIIITSDFSKRKQTIHKQIHQYFQQICYSLMQPSGSRGNQAVFWNCSIFDKPFFDTMYGDFYYPDGSKATWESVNWLQRDFLHWLNQERLRCILTFPVNKTAA